MPRTSYLSGSSRGARLLPLLFVLVGAVGTSSCASASQAAAPGSGANAASTPPPESTTAPLSAAGKAEQWDARLSAFAYPFEVHTRAISSQGLDLAMVYMDVGPKDAPAVLLLHGKNFSGAYWERTANDLVAQGYRVVIPDQIGFGKSSKPAPYHYNFSAMVKQTEALLDALGVGEVQVVGHSMGGMVATRFALMLPERTTRLVLVNPIGLEDWQALVPYATVDTLYAAEMKKTPDAVRAYMQEAYFDGQWKPEYNDIAAIQMGWCTSDDKIQLAWVSALTADMIFTQPVVHDFARIAVPTLLIIGTRDRTALGKNRVSAAERLELGRYDRLGRQTRDAIPNAVLLELPGVGHMPQVEAYEAYVNALTRFLAGGTIATTTEG